MTIEETVMRTRLEDKALICSLRNELAMVTIDYERVVKAMETLFDREVITANEGVGLRSEIKDLESKAAYWEDEYNILSKVYEKQKKIMKTLEGVK